MGKEKTWKTLLPADFQVNHRHRQYCIDKGWPSTLPDQFLGEFKTYFDPRHAQNPKKHIDWDRTFIMWIRRASPLGTSRMSFDWERKLEAAKQAEKVKPTFAQARAQALRSLDEAIILDFAREERLSVILGLEGTQNFWPAVHHARVRCLELEPEERAFSERWLDQHGYGRRDEDVSDC